MALRHVHQLQPSSINKTFSGGILAGALSDGVSRKMGLGLGPLGTSDVQPFCKAKSRTRIWRFSHFFHSAKVAGVVTNMSTESGVQQAANLISLILYFDDLWRICSCLERVQSIDSYSSTGCQPSLRFWGSQGWEGTGAWNPKHAEPLNSGNLELLNLEPLQTLYLQLLSLETLET
jgi:hypothetical protein